MRRTFSIFLPVALMIPPIILYFWYVHSYGVNVLFADEWEVVPVVRDWYQHTLSLRELWGQHAYNRMVVPRLLTLMTAHLTSFNTKDYMYAGAALLVASYVCLVSLYVRPGSGNLMAIVPTAYVYFGLIQWENSLWGFQMAWYLVLFCLIAGLVALSWLESDSPAWNKAALPVALALNTAASVSSLQGLFLWPCGLLYLLCRRSRRIHVWIWIIWGSVISALYFVEMNFDSTGGPPLLDFARNPIRSVQYFFIVPGSIFPVHDILNMSPEAMFLSQGIIGLLLFGISLWIVAYAFAAKQHKGTISIEAALILFALLFDATLVPGRSAFGIAQAQASRYTTYNLLFLVMIYLGLLSMTRTARKGRTFLRATLGIVCALLLLQLATSLHFAISAGHAAKAQRIMAADVLANYRIADDSFILRYQYPYPAVFRERAAMAEAYQLSLFSTPEANRYREAGIVPGGDADKVIPVPGGLQQYLAQNSRAHESWLWLSIVYSQRPDLQSAFPRESAGFPQALLEWAMTFGVREDSSLLPFKEEYEILNGLSKN